MHLQQLLKQYDYSLPKSLIAQKPAHPRDKARLLIYNRRNKKVIFDSFQNLKKYLPKNSELIFNQTRVIPARLNVQKKSGGKAEILYISHNKRLIKIISNRKLALGKTISLFDGRQKVIWFKVKKQNKKFYLLEPSFPINRLSDILRRNGKTPLPPYLKGSSLSEKQRRIQYQTIIAKAGASIDAPTAS
jgi:S-adenosylmethionine:tRNA ribosyltransferase-isomerase